MTQNEFISFYTRLLDGYFRKMLAINVGFISKMLMAAHPVAAYQKMNIHILSSVLQIHKNDPTYVLWMGQAPI